LKKKIIGILLSTLLIATTATTTLGKTTTFNEMNDINENNFKEIEIEEENKITIFKLTEEGDIIPIPKGDPWIDCMAACLAIGGIAGNCLWAVIGCTLAPVPLNPCCILLPVFCGVDIGLFFGCLSVCAGYGSPPSQEAIPCIPPHIMKLTRILKDPDNPQQPLFFLGILCLLQHLNEITNWLTLHGYDVPDDFSTISMINNMQNQKININTGDCGC